jgi:holo-[acyl-carrier protein] synthase
MTDSARSLGRPHVHVGVDIALVSQIRAGVERFGSRYLDRVFTSGEQQSATGAPETRMARLAGRFAAKEATLKALRVSGEPPMWREIEVLNHPDGWPEMRLSGAAAQLAARRGVTDISVSLSHEGDHAIAVVACTCIDSTVPTPQFP